MTGSSNRHQGMRTDIADRTRAFPLQEVIRLLHKLNQPSVAPEYRSGIIRITGCTADIFSMTPYEQAKFLKEHPRVSAMLLMILEISACRICDYYTVPKDLSSFRETARLFMRHYLYRPYEQLTAVGCDKRRRLKGDLFVSAKGRTVDVSASLNDIIRYSVNSEASCIVIAHNHPVSLPIPSQEDICSTEHISEVLRSLDITLADHIIISGTTAYSMRLSGEYSYIFGSSSFYRDNIGSMCTFNISENAAQK